MTKSERIRIGIFAMIPIVFAVSLAYRNPRFTILSAVGHPMPYLLMGMGMITLLLVLLFQAPGPPDGVPVKKIWRWADPLVVLLLLLKLASGWIFLIIFGELSGWYATPDLSMRISRATMFVAGYIATVAGLELLVRTVIARRRGETKEVEVYGEEHVEDEVGD